MTLIKTGGGITDIRGGFGDVYFTRDKSGLHCTAKPRRVRQRTAAQDKQRNAFSAARAVTKDPRWVSWLMYRLMNGLPIQYDAIVTGNPVPDCTGTYELAGTYAGKDYYKHKDSEWYIWYFIDHDDWYITDILGVIRPVRWLNEEKIEGTYTARGNATGDVFVKIKLRPPPVDYQIPHLQEP